MQKDRRTQPRPPTTPGLRVERNRPARAATPRAHFRASRAGTRHGGAIGSILRVVFVSCLVASAGGTGIAYMLQPSPTPQAAAFMPAPSAPIAPALLAPPAMEAVTATTLPPIQPAGPMQPASPGNPTPASSATAPDLTLEAQRREIEAIRKRLEQINQAMASQQQPKPLNPTASSAGPALAAAPSPLPAVDVPTRPEPKKPIDIGGPAKRFTMEAPPAPSLRPAREAVPTPAQLAKTRLNEPKPAEIKPEPAKAEGPKAPGVTQPAGGTQVARQSPVTKAASKPVAKADEAAPRSYSYKELEQIKVGDSIPDWGRVNGVLRDAQGGIQISTESGVIRKDAP